MELNELNYSLAFRCRSLFISTAITMYQFPRHIHHHLYVRNILNGINVHGNKTRQLTHANGLRIERLQLDQFVALILQSITQHSRNH